MDADGRVIAIDLFIMLNTLKIVEARKVHKLGVYWVKKVLLGEYNG